MASKQRITFRIDPVHSDRCERLAKIMRSTNDANHRRLIFLAGLAALESSPHPMVGGGAAGTAQTPDLAEELERISDLLSGMRRYVVESTCIARRTLGTQNEDLLRTAKADAVVILRKLDDSSEG